MLSAFMDGKESLGRRRWFLRTRDSEHMAALQKHADIDDFIAELLVGRGFGGDNAEDIDSFLNPKLRDHLPEPYIFTDMEKAVHRIGAAIERHESFVIFADYDVDGATSLTLLKAYFAAIGIAVDHYIPERLHEGYGLSEAAVETLHSRGHKLLVTLDCGTSAAAALRRAADLGMDVIIIDHHAASERPSVFACINPNVAAEAGVGAAVVSDYSILAAVGVSFLFIVALNRHLRTEGFFSEKDVAEPNLLEFLDLVALGTVCDVMPLRGLNRVYVRRGLEVLNRRRRLGLRALCEVCGGEDAMTAEDLGFRLGPRLNAASRMGESQLAAALLLSRDIDSARALAFRLHELNRRRQEEEAQCLHEALRYTEHKLSQCDYPYHVIAHGLGWGAGLVGIIAARLKDRLHRPAIAISFCDGVGTGSGRSLSGIDLGAVVRDAKACGLLESGGGHAQAVGLTIRAEQLEKFDAFVGEHIAAQCKHVPPTVSLALDMPLSLAAARMGLLAELRPLEPFGHGHPEPLWLFNDVRVGWAKIMAENHISCQLSDAAGVSVRAVLFFGVHNDAGAALLNAHRDDEFHIAGHIRPPYFKQQDKSEILIKDVMQTR